MEETIWDMSTRRRILLSIALKRAKPGSGSNKNFLMKRTSAKKWIDVTPLFGRTKWAVIGAVATRLYMPERGTMDMDIIIKDVDSKTVRRKLEKGGFIYKSELTIGGSTWLAPGKKLIDVLEGKQEWLDEALSEAKKNKDGQGLPILPFRFLVLLKFQSGRALDLADISRMLGQATGDQISETKKLFQMYEPDGMDDLQNIITLGQLEFK